MPRLKDQTQENLGVWERFARGREPERLPRGSIIYTPDQPAQALLLLSSGQVRLHLVAPEKRTLTLKVVEPGQLFGLVVVASEDQYDSVAEALTAVQLYRIDRTEITRMLADDPNLALALLEELGQHRLAISHRLDEITFKSVPARLATLLLDMSRGHDGENSIHVPRRSHRQLAEMINAYRETVTKVINQFRAARLLEIDRSTITLVNRSGLEELAQGW